MMSVWRDPEMPHARLARNTTASSLALSPDIVLPAALHFLQLTPTLVHTDGLYLDLASQKSRQFTPTLGKRLYSGQVTKCRL